MDRAYYETQLLHGYVNKAKMNGKVGKGTTTKKFYQEFKELSVVRKL